MSTIDVTSVLFDTDIAGQQFQVVRRQQVVNTYGETILAVASPVDVIGSITPTGGTLFAQGNSLIRTEAYTTQSKTIKVITTYRLRGPGKDSGNLYQPDIILWNGDSYVVTTLNEYTAFGVGFVEVDCISIDYTVEVP